MIETCAPAYQQVSRVRSTPWNAFRAGLTPHCRSAGLPLRLPRYLGGFVDAASKRATWLAEQVETWWYGVKRLAMVARRFPQTAYAGLTKSLQFEWQYLQQVVPGLREAFGLVEEALRDKFFPALLQVDAATVERFCIHLEQGWEKLIA